MFADDVKINKRINYWKVPSHFSQLLDEKKVELPLLVENIHFLVIGTETQDYASLYKVNYQVLEEVDGLSVLSYAIIAIHLYTSSR